MTNAGKHPPWFILALVGIAALFRLPGLAHMPPPLNQDEASRGYDAWCLLETGADRHGARWPFFLKSFGPGDYTAALTTYLTVPFVAWLGPTATAMRLPDALLGVATVLLLYLWLRRQVNEQVALLAAGVLAVDPWHIALCRTAHESGFTPFFLVFALLAMHRAGLLPAEKSLPPSETGSRHGRYRSWWGFAAGFALAMHTWAYPATRLFTPLFCLAILVTLARYYLAQFKVRDTRATILAAVLGLVIGAIPLWWTAFTHPEYLAARAHGTLLIYRSSSVTEMAGQFLANYAANLHPRYWYLHADEMSGPSIPDVGQHLVILAPLWWIGLIRILTRLRRCPWSRLLFAWLLLYPIPAAICGDWNPHIMRTVSGIILFPIITAIGGQWILARLAVRQRWVGYSAVLLILLALVANVSHFSDAYFRRFLPFAESGYQTGLVQAFDYVSRHKEDADFVLVTNWANQPYIYALLQEPIPPTELAKSPPVVCYGPKGFDQVLAVGRYLFTPRYLEDDPEVKSRFQNLLSSLPPDGRGLVIDLLHPPGGEPPDAPIVYRTVAAQRNVTRYNKKSYVVRRWSPPGRAPP